MLFKQRVTEAGLLEASELDAIEKESKSASNRLLASAKAAPICRPRPIS